MLELPPPLAGGGGIGCSVRVEGAAEPEWVMQGGAEGGKTLGVRG